MASRTDKRVLDVPRVTSRALAMRPESRRKLAIAACVAIAGATALGALVAYVGAVHCRRQRSSQRLSPQHGGPWARLSRQR